MNITVINGSPKGKYSITLQTVRYLEKKFPEHQFSVLQAGQIIKTLEKDFAPAVEMLEKADLILFCYPVYTFLAPSQLHRFIELMKEKKVQVAGKFVSQITTSMHFYDVTAHRYIEDNCMDMQMKFIQGLSADMDDLLTEKGQKQAEEYFQYVQWCVEKDSYEPLQNQTGLYASTTALELEEDMKEANDKTGDVVIITDCEQENVQLGNMIQRFQRVLPYKSRIVNLREFPFRGGCLG